MENGKNCESSKKFEESPRLSINNKLHTAENVKKCKSSRKFEESPKLLLNNELQTMENVKNAKVIQNVKNHQSCH